MRGMADKLMKCFGLAMCLMVAIPAAAQTLIQSSDFSVVTSDAVSIHVHRKTGAQPSKTPVLLVHGTWVDARVWDFPGRSVMDYLAARGYDAYALDLRGMGSSDRPVNYFTFGLLDRVRDVIAVATYIVTNTGKKPVIAGWSEGGLLTGLVAAQAPNLVAGVGLFSIPADGFNIPPSFQTLIASVVGSGVDRYLPPADAIYTIAFGFDPVTGKPTISPDAFGIFLGMTQPDSVRVVLEEASPDYFHAVIAPIWPSIRVPALVVDGALDLVVGEEPAQALYDALGSDRKQLIVFPRNAHGWFLEDNSDATLRVFDRFLSQF